MAISLNELRALIANTKLKISSNKEWVKFLQTASRNYKYKFKDQIAIFAQKPEATACANFATWNKLGFKINKGTNGIGLIENSDFNNKVKYIFDVSDTREHKVNLWEVKEEYAQPVKDRLSQRFGKIKDTFSFEGALIQTAKNVVNENYESYLSDLIYEKKNSYLRDFDDDSIKNIFKNLVSESVAYMLLNRCHIEPAKYFDEETFAEVRSFNSSMVINILGTTVNKISQEILREIEQEVKHLQHSEKNISKLVEKSKNIVYTKNEQSIENNNERVESNDTTREISKIQDRDNKRERNNVSLGRGDGGLPTKLHSGGTTADEQMGHSEEEISDGTQRGEIRNHVRHTDSLPTSTRDRQDGVGDGGTTGQGLQGEIGSDRGTQGKRPNGVGGQDEQHQPHGQRSDSEPTDIRLNNETATAEEKSSSAVVFAGISNEISQEEIDSAIQGGSGVCDGKYRIYEQFLKKEKMGKNVAFLKNEYGVGGSSSPSAGSINNWHDAKGLTLNKTIEGAEKTKEVFLSWPQVSKRISELVEADRYLDPKAKAHYPVYLDNQEELEKRWKVAKEYQAIIREYNGYMTELKDYQKCLNQYVLIDCGSRFALSDKKTHASKSQGEYILPLMQSAMETVIAENAPQKDRALAMLEVLNGDMANPVLPEPEPEYEYRYHLGDTIYIGANEYEIISFDENTVRLFDNSFPLLNKEIQRADFDNKVQENPANNHLRFVVETEKEAFEPYVVIDWSENKNFDENERLSFQEADKKFKEVELQTRKYYLECYGSLGGYDKTRGTVYYQKDGESEETDYQFRYDICDYDEEHSGLYNHIKGFWEEYITEFEKGNHADCTKEEIEEVKELIEILKPYQYLKEEKTVEVIESRPHGEEPTEIDFDVELPHGEEPTEKKEKYFSYLIGKEVKLDNSMFRIDTISQNGKVNLFDLTLYQEVGYPISRVESLDFVRNAIERQEKEILSSLPVPKVRPSVTKSFDLHPNVTMADRHNFNITDDELGNGTPLEKFQYNIQAIKTLKQLEQENRFATPQEQETLVKYVGWGGLTSFFEETNSRYQELKSLLDEQEYAQARESSLTAFYTSPVVIKSMYWNVNSLSDSFYKECNLNSTGVKYPSEPCIRMLLNQLT